MVKQLEIKILIGTDSLPATFHQTEEIATAIRNAGGFIKEITIKAEEEEK